MGISITIISDTHLRHGEIELGSGDLLIHCGDMFNLSNRQPSQLAFLDDWFGRQSFDQILCIGGNHDLVLEDALSISKQPFKNAYCLHDESFAFRDLDIYGSPWVPGLPTHAFSRNEAGLRKAWADIPANVDILITHTPAFGILDKSSRGRLFGCPLLAKELERISPRLHCFGHVHASAGMTKIAKTLHVNAAWADSGAKSLTQPRTLRMTRRH